MKCPVCDFKLRKGQETERKVHMNCDICKTLVVVRKDMLRIGESDK